MWQCAVVYLIYLFVYVGEIRSDKIVGFHKRHDSHATRFRDAGPLTPRHKCTVYWRLILSYLKEGVNHSGVKRTSRATAQTRRVELPAQAAAAALATTCGAGQLPDDK